MTLPPPCLTVEVLVRVQMFSSCVSRCSSGLRCVQNLLRPVGRCGFHTGTQCSWFCVFLVSFRSAVPGNAGRFTGTSTPQRSFSPFLGPAGRSNTCCSPTDPGAFLRPPGSGFRSCFLFVLVGVFFFLRPVPTLQTRSKAAG